MQGLVLFLYRPHGSGTAWFSFNHACTSRWLFSDAPSIHCCQCQGHPFSIAHCSTPSCPLNAAYAHVTVSHGQPFARAHCSISSCPFSAANVHVTSFHWQPFARAHCSTSRCPLLAANEHVCSSHGQPFARAHCSTSRCRPLAATQHVLSSHGQPLRPLQYFELPAPRRKLAHLRLVQTTFLELVLNRI